MTTIQTPARQPKHFSPYRLPDPPERNPDEVTVYDQIYDHGDSHNLAMYLGNTATTLVTGERWLVASRSSSIARAKRPDLLIAFDVNPALYWDNNGYIVSEQGKPPDLVLEIASPSTGDEDTGPKRTYYANLGIPEYWRFDATGDSHGAKLAGDQLVGGRYTPMPVVLGRNGVWRGYSAVLGLELHWNNRRLVWVDPATGLPIPTHEYHRDLAAAERAQRDQEAARADDAEAERDQEAARAEAAEAQRDQAAARADDAETQRDQAAARAEAAEARARAAARADDAETQRDQAAARAEAAEARARALAAELQRLRNNDA